MEAKASGIVPPRPLSTAKDGGASEVAHAPTPAGREALLRRAYNQLHGYVNAEHGTIPPYLMVVDVPHELIIWDGWTGRFGGFARGERIRLEQLPDKPELVALLQDIFTNPAARDPRGIALRVTKDIAGNLAQLAAAFEDRGHAPEQVARFLMRCVFCFFAEDVGLLPNGPFKLTRESASTAGDFGAEMIDRFNGHFFQSVESLPLEPADVQLLVEAAGFDWSARDAARWPSISPTTLSASRGTPRTLLGTASRSYFSSDLPKFLGETSVWVGRGCWRFLPRLYYWYENRRFTSRRGVLGRRETGQARAQVA